MDKGCQFEGFGVGPDCHQLHGLVHKIVEIEGHGLQLQMASFDFRNIQDIVNEIEQAGGGAAEAVDVFLLVR